MTATVTAPATAEEAAELLASSSAVRVRGGGTKSGWGTPVDGLAELRTGGLDRFVEHAEGDFTAVLEAGASFADAQQRFAGAGQMLALDPPADPERTTIGGVVAAADSGPLRHRYGAPRDLVIGVTLALADGTVAKAGGNVIKNVAGYDLSKLSAGSFGTLGLICKLSLRLHPKAQRTTTAIFRDEDPEALAERARELAAKPLACDSLDVRWQGGEGAVLVRFSGETCRERAEAIGAELDHDDDELWREQRDGQRGTGADVVLRVAGVATQLADVFAEAERRGGAVVGRAAIGTSWIRLPSATAEELTALREALRPARLQLTDAPAELRAELDPWDVAEGPELELMRRVKERFDPKRVLNPGIYVGGI